MKEKSCGCIIIDNNKVLLVQQNQEFWGFPKGHVEGDETEEETALREVKEETNLDVKILGNKKYKIEYVTDKGNPKEVIFFLASPLNKDIKKQDAEIKNIKWLGFEDALKTITYDNTRELFRKVLNEL